MARSRRFEDAYQQHLKSEQRREVLDTLRDALQRSTTLGEVIDAADTVGWGEAMGDLRLADLAAALKREAEEDGQTLTERLAAAKVALVPDDESEDDDEDEADLEAAEASKKKITKKTSKKAASKKTAKKAATKKTAKKAASKKAAKKAATKKATKKAAKKKSKKK